MPSHRRTIIHRFRISDDVLLAILEYLDPPTLWRACKAFRRVYSLTMEYQSLRYKYELAISGMKDGPVAYSKTPPLSRLQLLLTYRRDWLQLAWTHELRLQIPMPAQVGSSGGFVHQIHSRGIYSTLELSELPSSRKNRPPSLTRHMKYTTTSAIDCVAADLSQALIVTGHIFSHQGHIGIQLHFRDLWNFGKHPRARALNYEVVSQVSSAVMVRMAILVYGSKLAVSLAFSGGKTKHLILNWSNFDARWLDDQDIQFLDETYLLGVNSRSGSPTLSLYNVSKVASVFVVREFELPETWTNTAIKFSPNSSPKSDTSQTSDALFYTAPETRVLVLTCTPVALTHSEYYPMNWLFLKESYFRYPSRKDGFRVTWRQWGQYCLVKEIDNLPGVICGPYTAGNKVFYVENAPAHSSRSHTSRSTRLRVIDFSPFAEPADLPRGWTSVGPRASLIPIESSRTIPSSSVDGLLVNDFSATEDNIVLFLEAQQGYQSANVLTFGTPVSGSNRSRR